MNLQLTLSGFPRVLANSAEVVSRKSSGILDRGTLVSITNEGIFLLPVFRINFSENESKGQDQCPLVIKTNKQNGRHNDISKVSF